MENEILEILKLNDKALSVYDIYDALNLKTTEDLKNEIVSTCEIMFKQENKNKDNISNFDSKIHSIAVRGLEFYQEQRITRPKQ